MGTFPMFYNARAARKGGILLFLYTVRMSWAVRRQVIVVSVLLAVVVALVAAIVIPIVYETPSCSDRKQNQDETGVDCGGACTRLCLADAREPRIDFVRHFTNAQGRTDAIAYVTNPNRTGAIDDARFSVEVYGTDGTVLARSEGTVDLAPGATVPVYLPNVFSGNLEVARAFITFDPNSLVVERYEDERIIPRYNNDALLTGAGSPRVSASFTNPSAYMLRDIPVIATVFDASGNAIGATQTLLSELPPQGSAEVVFVWNEPFSAAPARIDVVPVVEL